MAAKERSKQEMIDRAAVEAAGILQARFGEHSRILSACGWSESDTVRIFEQALRSCLNMEGGIITEKIGIRSERFTFYYCRQGQCAECPGERHSALKAGSLEELCVCLCHDRALNEGTEYREEAH